MKTLLLPILILYATTLTAQITTPIVKAGFGVDAELRANYFNNFVTSGNDDWFNNGTVGTGQFVIDTTGAYKMMQLYAASPAARKLPFFRTMRVPQYSIINNRLWIDAVYIRDYNGNANGDSTAFVSSNKNGDSPGNWSGGITSVLDKNDIAEMMIHVRRAGPLKNDSLWFMGGLSLQGTTGNRYFDFELYQTDIFYSRSTGQFTNYGPDAGHTSWQLDAAGNITAPGDVIFTAEYSSSSLTNIEARIWINKATMSITPLGFDWVGGFDGASTGSQYGYANIRPKTAGAYYTGLQSGNGTWAGPFGFIDGGNNLVTTYSARQFMEFSVNLSKLGLDPITLLGGSACGLPFRRILVKTRSSTSFSSELKDFIGPFDFFTAPAVQAVADVPIYCGKIGVSEINVSNPASASVYTWTTPDGNITSAPTGPTITVNQPGTYIVTQQLLDGCSSFSSDTVVIGFDANCIPLQNTITSLRGLIKNKSAQISWRTKANNETSYFELQRSFNGVDFETVANVETVPSGNTEGDYGYNDDLSELALSNAYYRVKSRLSSGASTYSSTIRLSLSGVQSDVTVYPNPVGSVLQLAVPAEKRGEARVSIYSQTGALIRTSKYGLHEGVNQVQMNVSDLKLGSYMVEVNFGGKTFWKKVLVNTTLQNK